VIHVEKTVRNRDGNSLPHRQGLVLVSCSASSDYSHTVDSDPRHVEQPQGAASNKAHTLEHKVLHMAHSRQSLDQDNGPWIVSGIRGPVDGQTGIDE
jgi:hypothetical protein